MPSQHPKRTFLETVGALHLHPEHVRAQLFMRHRFFDPLDKVQVKYEMLRAHAINAQRVTAVVPSLASPGRRSIRRGGTSRRLVSSA